MTTYSVYQGRTITLPVEWYDYPGGPASVVTNVTIEIKPAGGGASVVGPTSSGVVNVATGLNTYQWSVPPLQSPGDYAVIWSGTDAQGDTVTATDILTIAVEPTPVTGNGLPAGLCEGWPVIWPKTASGLIDLPLGAETVTGTAVAVATEVLYALTARRFGLCSLTLRPCKRECYSSSWWSQTSLLPFTQTLTPMAGSYWLGMSCGGCGTDCSCTNISEVALPGPVYDVTQVKVDGVVLTKNVQYRLDSNRLLVRLGGEWPSCNDLNLADTQPNTWSVTIQQGEPVPTLGQVAAGELAAQFVHMLLDTGDCMLPKPVQSIARQGVNITFLDPNEVFANGRIGLYTSDLFIQTYNPDGRRRRAKVYNIDSLSTSRRLGS